MSDTARIFIGAYDGTKIRRERQFFWSFQINRLISIFQKIKSIHLKFPIKTEKIKPKAHFPKHKHQVRLSHNAISLPVWQSLKNLKKIQFVNLRLPVLSKRLIPHTAKVKTTPQVVVKAFIAGVVMAFVFISLPWNTYQWLMSLPNPKLLSRRDLNVTTKIYDRNGILLYEIYADQNRSPIPLSEIPDHLKKAVIAIEDKEFYRHSGISLRGIARALYMIYQKKQIQGGSTLTQQLIKSALLSPETKLSRKIKEATLAIWAEQLYSKDQILEMYLNQVPFGGTAWGVEAASRMYFGKSVKDVSLAEAAILAGLPAAPSDYSPFGNNPEKAFERQEEVLRRMAEEGFINKNQEELARAETITFAPQSINMRAPHFVMYIRKLLEERYSKRMVEHGGLEVITSLDISVQEKAEDTVKRVVSELKRLNVTNGAVTVINPKTGEILAMVGSQDYWDIEHEGNVNVALSVRPPGSTIKVVNYATALEKGYTAATLLNDSPVVYKISASETYKPVNYDLKFHGLVPVRYALANSYNIPAVKVLDDIGINAMVEKGRAMGITSWDDDKTYGLSLTLGGAGTTMLDLTRVFGTLANKGKRVDLLPVLKITDFRGHVLEHNIPKSGPQVVREEAAWIISNILADNQARSSAFGYQSELVIPGKTVSVKTGTSNDKRDNWTLGYTPSIEIATWVGNNDNSPMSQHLSSGLTGASTIWHSLMEEMIKDKLDEIIEKPEGVIKIPCYFGRDEYFISGTEPSGGRCQPIPTPSPTQEQTPA